jgi:hypothetical protein
VWTREWIERGGKRSDLFDVHYLQTPSVFADVRIPRNRPAFAHATSFADLSDADLLVLARQRGFAGFATAAGAVATWHHEIDFQPPDSAVDVGRLERVDDTHMLEHALDSSYVESWHSTNEGDGRFLALRVERSERLDRLLLIAGDEFLYVRNRERDLPVAESLDSLIIATRATRSQIIAYVDCEFSVGRVRGGTGPWEIQYSTLPWREGRHLAFVDDIAVSDGATILRSRVQTTDRWSIPVNTLARAEIAALFPTRR